MISECEIHGNKAVSSAASEYNAPMNQKARLHTLPVLLVLLMLALFLAACQEAETAVLPNDSSSAETAQGNAGAPPAAPATFTPPPPTIAPTPTPPLAALVNGQPILLTDYEKELARYEQAQEELGLTAESNYQMLVLDALIERELMRQAAAVAGVIVPPETVEERLAELRTASGENGSFETWLAANQYTEEEFRAALATELVAEQMIAAVTADLPEAVEQVRARYIQVDDAQLAQSLLEQIRAGADFAALAQQNSLDQITGPNGGDLGFFAQGSLLVPEVEAAAFSLQPNEVSEVISAPNPTTGQTTYYIVQTLERDPNRPLTADMRHALLQQQVQSWLDEQWQRATVIRFVEE